MKARAVDRPSASALGPALVASIALASSGWAVGADVGVDVLPKATTHPVVLIGIDALDADLMQFLFTQGQLPHLKALSDHGVKCPLQTFYNGDAASIWTSIASGRTKHDTALPTIGPIRTVDARVDILATARKVPDLWELMPAGERTAAAFGWWASWPASPINGTLVTDQVPDEKGDRLTWPERSSDELTAVYGQAMAWSRGLVGAPHSSDPANEGGTDRLIAYMALDQLRQAPADLTMLYLHHLEPVSIAKWKYIEPRYYSDTRGLSGLPSGPVVDAYRRLDLWVGELAKAAPPGARIVVLSDHGMMAQVPERVEMGLDIRTILSAAGLATYDEHGFLAPDQSIVFALPEALPGILPLRLNIRDREPQGIVDPADRTRVAEQVAERMRGFTYKKSGQRVFDVAVTDYTRGDIVVSPREDVTSKDRDTTLVWETRDVPRAITEIVTVSGDAKSNKAGLLMASGPGLKSGISLEERCTIFDVAPTILDWMGLPPPPGSSGHVLRDLGDALNGG